MSEMTGRDILILGPGRSLMDNKERLQDYINANNPIVIALNFDGGALNTDYIFSSNMRRYAKIQGKTPAKCIITSNMKDYSKADYIVNFSSYASKDIEIIDNSGVMLLKLLIDLGVKHVTIAGMDGYSGQQSVNYYDSNLEYDFSSVAEKRNYLIAEELHAINKVMKIQFLTPSMYEKMMED